MLGSLVQPVYEWKQERKVSSVCEALCLAVKTREAPYRTSPRVSRSEIKLNSIQLYRNVL